MARIVKNEEVHNVNQGEESIEESSREYGHVGVTSHVTVK